MGLHRLRIDSISALRKKITTQQLMQENQQLQSKVLMLEKQLEDTQVALCDVYELLIDVSTE